MWGVKPRERKESRSGMTSAYHEMNPHQRGWQVEQATLRVIVKLNDPVLVFRMLKIS
jgi:hypothetical protein